MAKFVCEKHPKLQFSEDGRNVWASFVEGVFETADEAVIAKLRDPGCAAKFGIAEADAPVKEPADKPAKKAAAPKSSK